MARLGRAMPNRPYIAHTSRGSSLDAATPSVWSVSPPRGRWQAEPPKGRWVSRPPHGRWTASSPRGG